MCDDARHTADDTPDRSAARDPADETLRLVRVEALVDERPECAPDGRAEDRRVGIDGDRRRALALEADRPLDEEEDGRDGKGRRDDARGASSREQARHDDDRQRGEKRRADHRGGQDREPEVREEERVARRLARDELSHE